MNNFGEALSGILLSNVGKYSISGILIIWHFLCSASSFNDKMELRDYSGKKINLWGTLLCMMPTLGSIFRFGVIFGLLFHSGENLISKEVSTPDPRLVFQTQSVPEPLKVGDEIIVENAPNRLQKWQDPYRETRYNGSAKNGDVGEILATKTHNGYTMHYVEWCNKEEINWVAEKGKDPKGKVYVKKR